jgi:hypothetical protein
MRCKLHVKLFISTTSDRRAPTREAIDSDTVSSISSHGLEPNDSSVRHAVT